MKWLALAPAALLALAGAGCDEASAAETETGTGTESGMAQACDGETRGMTFSAGMEVMGDASKAKIQLVDASPAPPIRDLNDWQLVLMDPAGEPLTTATVTVTPWMPDHGHGSPNPDTALIRDTAKGAWNLQNLDLFMAGYWEVHFDIELSETESERVTYGFCVD